MKKNEENAVSAFIEILQKIKGVEYEIVDCPEETNRNVPDVEVILSPKNKDSQLPKIAVEHTIVEAHEKQIAYVNQSYEIVEKINVRCQGKLPTNRYFILLVPPVLTIDTSKQYRDQFIEEMSNWVLEVAKTLAIDHWTSRLYNGHKVSLCCGGSSSTLNGKIGRMPMTPENPEIERKNRFYRAIGDKLAKLIKYKEKRFTTALLLEDISSVHGNPGHNWKDFVPSKYHSEFQLKIDYVVIFISHKNKMIVGLVWKEESQLYSEIPDNRRFFRFNLQRE